MAGQQEGELLTADAGQHLTGLEVLGPRRGRLLEQPVSGRVAAGVVVGLEVVEVEHGQRERLVVVAGRLTGAGQLEVPGAAVGGARERVGAGECRQLHRLRPNHVEQPSHPGQHQQGERHRPGHDHRPRRQVAVQTVREQGDGGQEQATGQHQQSLGRVGDVLEPGGGLGQVVHRAVPGGSGDQHVAGEPDEVVREVGLDAAGQDGRGRVVDVAREDETQCADQHPERRRAGTGRGPEPHQDREQQDVGRGVERARHLAQRAQARVRGDRHHDEDEGDDRRPGRQDRGVEHRRQVAGRTSPAHHHHQPGGHEHIGDQVDAVRGRRIGRDPQGALKREECVTDHPAEEAGDHQEPPGLASRRVAVQPRERRQDAGQTDGGEGPVAQRSRREQHVATGRRDQRRHDRQRPSRWAHPTMVNAAGRAC